MKIELKESNYDDQHVGGTGKKTKIFLQLSWTKIEKKKFFFVPGMVRLQVKMGSGGIRRCQDASRSIREHLAARYRPLQQVSPPYCVAITNVC